MHVPPRTYRIHIQSASVLQGYPTDSGDDPDYRDGRYFIDVPMPLSGDHQWQIVVESFHTNFATFTTGLILHCDGITQSDSYSTWTMGPTDAIVMCQGDVSVNQTVMVDSVGIPLNDLAWMRSKIMRFWLTTIDGSPLTYALAGNRWALSLIVMPRK